MKLNKYEKYLIALTVAIIIFCAGYFAGKGHRNTIKVSTTSSKAFDTEITAYNSLPDTATDTTVNDYDNNTDKININIATAEELKKLPGIGDVLAKRIIEYRNDYGDFSSVEEIMNVLGVGELKFDAIKDYITT